MDKYDSTFERQLFGGWMIRSSAEVGQRPDEISRPGFDTRGWYPTSVPSTVLAALVEDGVYEDPFFGMNLKKIAEEPYKKPWWYRVEFSLSHKEADKTVLLEFEGINYSANIWLNGQQIAASHMARGAFRQFQYDISRFVCSGVNVLALEVAAPKPGDFSIGFVDWNPPPPDRNMGLFRTVRLRFCGCVSIENPFVQTKLNLETLEGATLNVSTELVNHSDQIISGVLEGKIESIRIEKTVKIKPRSRETVEFTDLKLQPPKLWWPCNLGEPNLYDLRLSFTADGGMCDIAHVRFGIRDVQAYTNEAGHKGFKINGKKVLIEAAGWTDDLLLADTPQTIEAQIKYVRHINLNSIRLEGIWGKDQTLYDLCDRYGILMMVGWSCHWEHEQYLGKPVDSRYGGVVSTEDIELVSRSWRDQVLWLRNHPSIYVWTVASDKVPKPELEQRYIGIFKECDPTRPYLNSTGGIGSEQQIIGEDPVVSEISGCSGVKMLGPYAYTPPIYWYTDTQRGGAYGFNTETSPGAALPVLESVKKMIPENHLWPIDEFWEFHCGLNEFHTLNRYQEAINRRYGKPHSIEEFARKAQLLNYELTRPMFEAFRANRDKATGVVQWMLNAAWPKLYWQLYDKYLHPTGGFYATRKACEPLHLLYNYADHGIYIVNDFLTGMENLKAIVRVLNIDSSEVLHEELVIRAEPESAAKILEIPKLECPASTYFLDLRLDNERGIEIANNFYWLSSKPDVLDYEAAVQPWPYYTPSKEFADLTALGSLPAASVEIEHQYEVISEETVLKVRLTNISDRIAFFAELKALHKSTRETILPVFWQDNYISLLPGESRNIVAVLPLTEQALCLTVNGWNLTR